jgi:methionyl-tRNA formyltransferase
MTRVAFLGSKGSGFAALLHLIDAVRAPHQLVGVMSPSDDNDPRNQQAGMRMLCAENRIPFAVAADTSEMEHVLDQWKPDIAIVLGWYTLIRLERMPSTTFFGFHFSPLPRYRGNAPLVWQIIAGESELGVSFFRFGDAMDNGDLVDQRLFPLGANDTVADAMREAEGVTQDMLAAHLPALLEGRATLVPQSSSGATYCGSRIPADGRIDWRMSARRVHDFVRAQSLPYPGAYTTMRDGTVVRIWRTEVDDREYIGVPGGVAERGEGCAVVTCGEGAIRILEARIDGEGSAPPEKIFTSIRMRLGS